MELFILPIFITALSGTTVPLDHPKRDRVSGDSVLRIKSVKQKAGLSAVAVQELVAALNADNIKIRIEAANQLVNRIGNAAVEPVKAVLQKRRHPANMFIAYGCCIA